MAKTATRDMTCGKPMGHILRFAIPLVFFDYFLCFEYWFGFILHGKSAYGCGRCCDCHPIFLAVFIL